MKAFSLGGKTKKGVVLFVLALVVLTAYNAYGAVAVKNTDVAAPSVRTTKSLPPPTTGFLAGEDVTLSYDVVAAVQPNGDVRFTETIVENFGSPTRGIIRTRFLVEQVEGQLRKYPVEDVRVNVSPGAFEDTQVSVWGDELEIRVGDPDRRLVGVHTYEVAYTVKAMVDENGEVPYLNFDLIAGRPYPIQNFTGTVVSPVAFTETVCAAGGPLSAGSCDTSSVAGDEFVVSQKNVVAGQQVGVQLVFPAGSFPDRQEPILAGTRSPVLVAALSALTILFGVGGALAALKTRRRNSAPTQNAVNESFHVRLGGDPDGSARQANLSAGARMDPGTTPPVEFVPPQGLRPAHMGVLLGSAPTQDLFAATVVDLAARKWVTLRESESGWVIERSTQGDGALQPFEHDALQRMFGQQNTVETAELARRPFDNASTIATALQSSVAATLKQRGLTAKFRWDRKAVTVFGVTAAVSLTLLRVLSVLAPNGFGTAVVLAGACLASLSFTTRDTPLGEAFRWRVLGFRELFEHSENYHAQLAASTDAFRQYMGYAVLFGAVDRWAEAFPAAARQEVGFTPMHITAFQNDVHRTFASSRQSRTGSGGFSTGGSFSGGSVSGGSSSGGGGRW